MSATEANNYIAVATVEELEEGKIKGVTIDGKKLIVCQHQGEFYVLDGVCSHAGGPLCRGELDDGLVVCPWHGWEYDVKTGQCEIEPSLQQAVFSVKVDGDQILAALPE